MRELLVWGIFNIYDEMNSTLRVLAIKSIEFSDQEKLELFQHFQQEVGSGTCSGIAMCERCGKIVNKSDAFQFCIDPLIKNFAVAAKCRNNIILCKICHFHAFIFDANWCQSGNIVILSRFADLPNTNLTKEEFLKKINS